MSAYMETLVNGLRHGTASYMTQRGLLYVSWSLTDATPASGGTCDEQRTVRLRVTVPQSSRATVFVPIPQNGDGVVVTEMVEGVAVWHNGAFVAGAATGVWGGSLALPGEYAGGAIKLALGSGDFEFMLAATT